MTYSKVKITFTKQVKGKQTTTPIEFISWNGRPQLPSAILDFTTRLGGNQYVISTQKTQAVITNSSAVIGATTKALLLEKIQTLLDNFGNRATWTDEEGLVTSNFFIFGMTYNIKAVDGGALYQYIANCSISCTTDSTPNSK